MKKYRIFIVIWMLCLISGTALAALSPENVPAAVTLLISGAVCGVVAVFFIFRQIGAENSQKDSRLRALEQEVEALKQNMEEK